MYKSNEIDVFILKKCLEALLQIIQDTTIVLDSIIFNKGLELMLDLCDDIVSKYIDDDLGRNCLGLGFFILDILFRSVSEKNRRVITITLSYMKRIVPQHQQVFVRDLREIVSVMNFMWEHIVKHEELANEFVKKNGTYLLLDMVQKFPFVVKLITLSALVDLCEYGFCIPYMITWKRNGNKIIPMLMKIFRDENKRLHVKSGAEGQILDIRYPLMGKDQWFLTFCTCKPMLPGNATVSDLYLSCRPKIYALLQILYVRYEEEVNIANEHYKSFDDELNPKDEITRLLAENFLAIKLGEAWVELKEEFDRANITLTSIDQEILSILTQRALKLTQHVQVLQNDIIQKTYEKEFIKECQFYKHLAEADRTIALEALSELKSIARSSENMFRLSEKYKQNKQLDDAIKAHCKKEVPHRTYCSSLRVTSVFNEHINLSNLSKLPPEEPDLELVSAIDSTIQYDLDIPEDLLESP